MILICFLGAGWTEPLLFNTSFKNVTLIFLGSFLFRQKEEEKEYCLFPQLQQTVCVPFAGVPDNLLAEAVSIFRRYRIKIASFIALGMITGVLLCRLCYTAPEGYVVQRFYTDGLEEGSVYLDGPEDPAYENFRIMNYVDEKTPMQLVQGKAVMLETARYYVGSILIGGLIGEAAGLLYYSLKKSERQ